MQTIAKAFKTALGIRSKGVRGIWYWIQYHQV